MSRFATVCLLAVSITTQTDAQAIPNSTLPPKGYGTLRQSDVVIVVRTADVHITILPLDERVTRLLVPDAHQALHAFYVDRRDELDAAAPRRGVEGTQVFLVTVYGASNFARFDPEEITISSRNRYFRPLAVLPVSPRWAEHQIDRGETLTALYVFDRGLDPLHPLIVDYRGTRVATWERTLHRLEVERARVVARARGGPSD